MTVRTKTYSTAKAALNDYKYNSCDDIIKRIENCNFKNQRENADIINEIVLWKINRQTFVANDLILDINKLSKKVRLYTDISFNENEIKDIYNKLIELKGVSAAMASTILKMFMPEALPIIDQRAYREIYGVDMPSKVDSNKYFKYVEEVIKQFNKESGIKFSDMDKVLYQRDKASGKPVKY